MYKSIENPTGEDFLSLQFLKPLADPANKKFEIFIVGAGGTGGYVIRDLSRFLYSVLLRDPDYEIGLTIIDPDIVEEKNILRQNFLPSDLGKNKAEIMAARHSKAFNLEIKSVASFFDIDSFEDRYNRNNSDVANLIIIGCVDNNKARREIFDAVRYLEIGDKRRGVSKRRSIYWIDSGNERSSGQVILGNGELIPSVVQLFPEILEKSSDSTSTVSCAERLMQDEQNIFVNITAASHVLNLVRPVILNETITAHGVRFNIYGKTDTFCLTQEELS